MHAKQMLSTFKFRI